MLTWTCIKLIISIEHITCSVPACEISLDYWWGFLFTVFHVNIHRLKQQLSQKERKTFREVESLVRSKQRRLKPDDKLSYTKKPVRRPLWIYIRLHYVVVSAGILHHCVVHIYFI